MRLLIAILILVLGLVAAFRTDWVGKFKNEQKKRQCRICGMIMIVIGIILLVFYFLGVGTG